MVIYPERKKNSLKTWQFIVLLVLLVVMLATMFMPAYSVNLKTVKKAISRGDALFGTTKMRDGSISDEEIEKSIREAEINGIKLRNISPLYMMTFNISKVSNIDELIDDFDLSVSELTATNPLKVFLIVFYSVSFLLLVFLIISFIFKINKLIPLIINAVYGVISAGCFGFLRFGMLQMILKSELNAVDMITMIMGRKSSFSGEMGQMVLELVVKVICKIVEPLHSVAFLFAMIFGILIVVISIVSIIADFKFGSSDVDTFTVQEEWLERERERLERERIALERQKRELLELKNKVNKGKSPAVGIVQCVKGIATGQGLQIPADCKVIIGKSAQKANFIINDKHVSNVHCSIRYNPTNGMYTLIDHSSNGTFVKGNRLQKDTPTAFSAGTIVDIADGNNQIKLG